MKKFIYSLSVVLSALALTACNDFFEPDADDELKGSDYIGSDTEMYSGYLGIMTKLQAVGDKQILLTEPRGENIEITDRATPELIALYNYNPDLTGNSYADPAPYYDVIIACNDYIEKLQEYRSKVGVNAETVASLMSSALRVKVFIYKTLAETYGQAVWFDTPVTKYTEVSEANGFRLLDVEGVMDECLKLLDNGVHGVAPNLVADWLAWLDAANITSEAAAESEEAWKFMTPSYYCLYADVALWKAACLESKTSGNTITSSAGSVPYYQKAADMIFSQLDEIIRTSGTQRFVFSARSQGRYGNVWVNQKPDSEEAVSAITYDYSKNQSNSLLTHFYNGTPCLGLLRPAQIAIDRVTDPVFNPAPSYNKESRSKIYNKVNGETITTKFGSDAATAFHCDGCIYMYRSHQLYLMLCEALNHLSRFKALNAVLNNFPNSKDVLDAYILDEPDEWNGFNSNWTTTGTGGTISYPHSGIRACYEVADRPLVSEFDDCTEREGMKANDLQILDETMLELAIEGKVYPAMNRMALRYGDLSIVADRVCPKYEESGLDAEVRAKILDGANYVPYDLKFVK